ncbi:endonuclease/exonuclease/phosphatase family protein [Streptomyces sp. DSM 44915]|uniref:Endonuclease/exonuclease/phosphatase family protein n=1 Tax=Streptomyces chisholmiae TaxID=3075540 RepID=A0ABU2JL07_9ACTN|nr:endonuclease/exonuclease/phosphatase family protein [Streptomyces sp. DSM 44915]MDT0264938.1 endonuclease/exonuclease/phosphatase family protein [Streptomyces sp. DSM 44915]
MSVRVRVLSYNVRSLRDDRRALARVIRACAPDVVCVQEAPRFFRWRKQAGELARLSGLVLVAGGAPSCGTMIMSSLRAAVESTEETTFPLVRGAHRRGLASAVLRFGRDARLAVVSCHLSLLAAERRDQGERLLARAAAFDAPTVVAGDLNETPAGATFRRLAGVLPDARERAPVGGEFTFPAGAPRRRIDAVLCGPGVTPLACGVPTAPAPDDLAAASDHLPVLATLSL